MAKVIIMGGGVIGLCSAHYLSRAGWEVVVVDQGNMEDSCSYGNAGMIVPSYFVPLAAPGVIPKSLSWLFRSDSPLSLRPRTIEDWKWLLRFMRSATARHVSRSMRPLLDFSLYSKSEFLKLSREMDLDLQQKGVMMLAATASGYKKECQLAHKAALLGLDVLCLSPQEVMDIQGGVDMNIQGGVHYRCDAHLDPRKFMQQLLTLLESEGVRLIKNARVEHITRKGHALESLVLSSGHILSGDAFVLSAGSGAAGLAGLLGLSLPIMPGRGYSFMESAGAHTLPVPVLLSESKVAITPMSRQTRIAGGMELGRMGRGIQKSRVQGMLDSVQAYFPAWKLAMPEMEKIWSGHRPCSPDGLPYIGPYKGIDNLIIASGHGMMGLSLGPGTGAVVADLIQQKVPEVNLLRFAADRFA